MPLNAWSLELREIHDALRDDETYRPETVTIGTGWSEEYETHDVTYHSDEDGDDYALITFDLPKYAMAEIDGQTYGNLVGIRIYLGTTGTYAEVE